MILVNRLCMPACAQSSTLLSQIVQVPLSAANETIKQIQGWVVVVGARPVTACGQELALAVQPQYAAAAAMKRCESPSFP